VKISSGKSFESEITASLRALSKTVAVAYQNSNEPIAVCDHIVWINGTSILLEEKELRADRFPFSRISDAERKHMDGVTRAGCGATILIKHITPLDVRVFACGWPQWKALEHSYRYVHGAAKQARGSASFPVRPDWERPECLIELQRVSRRDLDGHSLGKHWDLSPILEGLFT
jgi:hypothetical protein